MQKNAIPVEINCIELERILWLDLPLTLHIAL